MADTTDSGGATITAVALDIGGATIIDIALDGGGATVVMRYVHACSA
jgi:hypothetical protein